MFQVNRPAVAANTTGLMGMQAQPKQPTYAAGIGYTGQTTQPTVGVGIGQGGQQPQMDAQRQQALYQVQQAISIIHQLQE